MNEQYFDHITKLIGRSTSRRQALKALAGITLGGLSFSFLGSPREAMAARPNPRPPICPNNGACLAIAIDQATGELSEGRCPKKCSAKRNINLVSKHRNWRALERFLRKKGFRPLPSRRRAVTLRLETSDGIPLDKETIEFYRIPKRPGMVAELTSSTDTSSGSPLISIYAIISDRFGAANEAVFNINGKVREVPLEELLAAVPELNGTPTELLLPPLSAGSGMVSTAQCIGSYALLCNAVALLSCDNLFGKLFKLGMKGIVRVLNNRDLTALDQEIAPKLDALALDIVTPLVREEVRDAFAKEVGAGLQKLGSKVLRKALGLGDICDFINANALCGTIDPAVTFDMCCRASSGLTCGSGGIGSGVCCLNSWSCAISPIGTNFCNCPSGIVTGSGVCCQQSETACEAVCAPNGECCPENRCPDGSCRDGAGQCGGGEPCGFSTCPPDRFCCHGTFVDVCCLAGWECCTNGCCPPGTHCCVRNGVVGCCLN